MLRTAIISLLVFTGCTPSEGETDLEDTDGPVDTDAAGDTDTDPDEAVTHTDNGDGTTTTVVSAADGSTWIYLDLDTGDQVLPVDPMTSPDWDVAFQRYTVVLNGGISGSSGVEAAALESQDFAALVQAPASGYLTDRADGDGDGKPEYALGGWFIYDPSDHTLSPADLVYVVRTTGGAYMKVGFLDYYDDAGNSGFPTFRWSPVGAP